MLLVSGHLHPREGGASEKKCLNSWYCWKAQMAGVFFVGRNLPTHVWVSYIDSPVGRVTAWQENLYDGMGRIPSFFHLLNSFCSPLPPGSYGKFRDTGEGHHLAHLTSRQGGSFLRQLTTISQQWGILKSLYTEVRGCPFSLLLPGRWIHGYTTICLSTGNVIIHLKGKTETRSAIAASKPSGVGENNGWVMWYSWWKSRVHLVWIDNILVCTCSVVPWTQVQPFFPEIHSPIVAVMPFTAGRTQKAPSWSPCCFPYLPGSSYVLCTNSKGHFYIKKILWVS